MGDWRDAAEKGWLAVRNATAAAVLWGHNQTTSHINAGLRKLARERGGEWAELRKDYGEAAHLLHSQAFYKGVYDNDVPALVRGAADYIRRVEELAG